MATTKVSVGKNVVMEKLMLMQDLTRRTGILHEIQVQNLYSWILIVSDFQNVSLTFSYDDKIVIYNVENPGGVLPDNIKERLEYLENCVKMLLGDCYRTRVVLDNKQIYPEVQDVRSNRKSRGKANTKGKRNTK